MADAEHISADEDFFQSGHVLNFVSLEDEGPCLPSRSSRVYRASNHSSSVVTFQDKIRSIHFSDMIHKSNFDEYDSFLYAQPKIVDFSVLSRPMYDRYFDDGPNIQDEVLHPDCINMLPRSRLSEDDCLNSSSHPQLFTSRYQQPWSIRFYKFQLGLINTREVLGELLRT
jgi:hypothetical protein